MNEVHGLKGPKLRVRTIKEATALVLQTHPGVYAEGSTAHWSWGTAWHQPENEIVAEAWPVRCSTDWWLRIKETV